MRRLSGKILLLAATLFAAFASPTFGAATTAQEAERLVGNWLLQRDTMDVALGDTISSVVSVSVGKVGGSDRVIHVANLDGGGYVVVAGDDRLWPILAFSDSGEWTTTEKNPLWQILRQDVSNRVDAVEAATASSGRRMLAGASAGSESAQDAVARNRAKWDSLLNQKFAPSRQMLGASNGKTSVSDVRVSKLLQTKWGQGSVAGDLSLGTYYCYNFYTPNHYPCGCVATAMAQIMRYHKFPTASVTPLTINGRKMMGGTYSWSNMPTDPCGGVTAPSETKRKAIGKLTYDAGVSVKMHYGKDASEAYVRDAPNAFKTVFGFASAKYCSAKLTFYQLTRANLNAGYPVLWSILGRDGHAIVVDGYGYSSNVFYVHANLGWDGKSNAWYNPNDGIITADGSYTQMYECVYDIFPTATNRVVVSGRVLSASGSPIKGATIICESVDGTFSKQDTTNDAGVWGITVPGGVKVSLFAKSNGAAAEKRNVSFSNSVESQDFTIANTSPSLIFGTVSSKYVSEPDGSISFVIPVASDPTIKVSVNGLPAGITYNAKTRTVSGKAKKPVVATVTATGTSATVTTPVTVAFTLEVKFPTLTVNTAYVKDKSASGKVTGGGSYPSGTKVSLKATPDKGCIFAGWYDGTTLLSQAASYSYAMATADKTLIAKFATVDEDAKSLSLDGVGTLYNTDKEGWFELSLFDKVSSLSQSKLTVAGLPAGLKYDAKTGVISGMATKPGQYPVKITASNTSATGKKSLVKTITIVVPNLKYDCLPNLDTGADAYVAKVGMTLAGFIDLTTAEGWKVSAVSGLPSGLTWNKAANTIGGAATKPGVYTVTISATKGGITVKSTVTVKIEALPGWFVGSYVGAGGVVEKNSYEVSYDISGTIDAAGKLSATMNYISLDLTSGKAVRKRGTLSASRYAAYYDAITQSQAVGWVGSGNADVAADIVGAPCFYYSNVSVKVGSETSVMDLIVFATDYSAAGDKLGIVLGVGNATVLSEYAGEIVIQDAWKRKDISDKPVLASSSIAKTIPITYSQYKDLYNAGLRSVTVILKSSNAAAIKFTYSYYGYEYSQTMNAKYYPGEYKDGKFECLAIATSAEVIVPLPLILTPGADGKISANGISIDLNSL